MKKIASLMIALMMLFSAFSLAEDAPSPAHALLEKAVKAQTLGETASLVTEAAALAADANDEETLFLCFQTLAYLDAEGQYAAELASVFESLTAVEGADVPQALLECMEILVYMGRQEELLEAAEAVCLADPKSDIALMAYCEGLYYSGREEEALALLSDERADGSMRLLDMRALILTDMLRYDEAIETYKLIDEKWPMWMTGAYGLYETYKISGDFERAARTIDRMIRMGAGDDLWLERARIRLWDQLRTEEALEELDALLRYDPEWADARSTRVSALTVLKRYDEALEDVRLLSETMPEYALLLKGMVHTNAKEWEKAEAALLACPEDSPYYPICQGYRSLVRMGGFADFDGAYEALALAFDAGALKNFAFDSLLYLGHYNRSAGALEQAALAFSAADDAVFDDPTALYYLGLVLRDAGMLDGMLSVISEMEARYPGHYDTMALRLVMEYSVGENEAALGTMQAIAEKFPDQAEKLAMLHASILARLGQTEQALGMAEVFLKTDEADFFDRCDHAYLLQLAGDPEGAQVVFEKAEAELSALEGISVQEGRIALETTRALVLLHAGDTDGCFAALSAAKEAGWPAAQILTWGECEQLADEPQLETLLEGVIIESEWNLNAPPALPTLE